MIICLHLAPVFTLLKNLLKITNLENASILYILNLPSTDLGTERRDDLLAAATKDFPNRNWSV